MADLWICIGSNLDDAPQRIADGVERLRHVVSDWVMCEPYLTPAEPDNGVSPVYLNTVAQCRFEGDPSELVERIKEIERLCGRTRNDDKVALDIDIVVIDDAIVRKRDFDREYFKKGYECVRKSLLNKNS